MAFLFAGLTIHYIATHRVIPSDALVKFPEPALTPALRELTVGEIEVALARLQFDGKDQLIIDSQTESTFSAASEALPVPAGRDVLARLDFLIGKQFAAARAPQVQALFRQYFHYKQEEITWRQQQPEPKTVEDEIRQFQFLSELQNRHFGAALTEKLYGEHRRLARYMFASRRLEKDRSVSAEEKQLRLEQLQKKIHGAE